MTTQQFGPDDCLMTLVPAGPFLMGLPNNNFLAEDHEKPQRQIELAAFWIDVYPVTNRQYRLFLQAGGYDNPQWWPAQGWTWKAENKIVAPGQWEVAGWGEDDQPVAGVSWYEAVAYARWAGRRLPTDAEWEKAARGTDGRLYPWGNDWPSRQRANFNGHVGRSTPVGRYPDGVSPLGCHDMAGNVNNWVSDWYWSYFGHYCVEKGLLTNPHLDDALLGSLDLSHLAEPARRRVDDPGQITEKADRGGGFATPWEYHEVLGCTRKTHWKPETRHPWNGFRTARDA